MSEQSRRWASTMSGHLVDDPGLRTAHHPTVPLGGSLGVLDREAREAGEEWLLAPGATRSVGAGSRAVEEVADPWRTCFERDRDRILHSPAFRSEEHTSEIQPL